METCSQDLNNKIQNCNNINYTHQNLNDNKSNILKYDINKIDCLSSFINDQNQNSIASNHEEINSFSKSDKLKTVNLFIINRNVIKKCI